jgi:DNA-binding LytR/AlgR family response regulator
VRVSGISIKTPRGTLDKVPHGGLPNPFDILFLDIELGDTTGITIADEIRKRFDTTLLIFVSAHESYCKDLFRYDTFDFLSKPVDEHQLQDALKRSYQQLKKSSIFFSYHVKNYTYRLPFDEIIYFESVLHKVKIVTLQGEHEFYGKIGDVEAELAHKFLRQACFARVHHSLLVNLEHVEKIAPNDTIVLHGGRTIHLARSRVGEVRRQMMTYFKDISL